MEYKECKKCLEVKNVSEFGKESRLKSGHKSRCKKCTNEYQREFVSKNRDKINKASLNSYYKYREKAIDRVKKYADKNKDRKKIYNKEYRHKNIDKINKKTLEYVKNRIKNDEGYRFTRLHRKLIYRLKIEKIGRTGDLLGYTSKDLKEHLGRYPTKNECIDHKVPVSWFIDKSNVKMINSLENLQILSRYENIKKHNSFCHPVSKNYYDNIYNNIKDEYKSKIKWIRHTLND